MKKSGSAPTKALESFTECYKQIAAFIERSEFYQHPTRDNNLEKFERFLTVAKAEIDKNPKDSHAHKHLIQLHDEVFQVLTALKKGGVPVGQTVFNNYSGKNELIQAYVGTSIKCLYRNITEPKTIPTPEITKAVQQVNHDPSVQYVQQGLERLLTTKFKFVPRQNRTVEEGTSLVLEPGCVADTHQGWFIKKLKGKYQYEFEPVEEKNGFCKIVIRHVECQKQLELLAVPITKFAIECIEKGERLEFPDNLRDECMRLVMLELFKLYPNLQSLQNRDNDRTSQIAFEVGHVMIDKILEQNKSAAINIVKK